MANIDIYQIAECLGMSIKECAEYYCIRTGEIHKELEATKKTLQEIAEISTRKVLDLKVILSDPNFYKPLSELEKNYE